MTVWIYLQKFLIQAYEKQFYQALQTEYCNFDIESENQLQRLHFLPANNR